MLTWSGRARAGLVGLVVGGALAGGCGGQTFDSGAGGTAGAGGAGAAAGSGASAGGGSGGGTSGGSGAGGASGAGGGSSGGSGAGGAGGGSSGGGGSGAAGGPGPECKADADCRLFSDCCSCVAHPEGVEIPGCDAACIQDSCAAQGVTKASCVMGRCITARTCDRSQVNCRAMEPECEPGLVPSVRDRCWGPCVPPRECESVAGCEVCAPGDACVQVSGGITGTRYHCVSVPRGCEQNRTCECMGRSVCSDCQTAFSALECGCPACL